MKVELTDNSEIEKTVRIYGVELEYDQVSKKYLVSKYDYYLFVDRLLVGTGFSADALFYNSVPVDFKEH